MLLVETWDNPAWALSRRRIVETQLDEAGVSNLRKCMGAEETLERVRAMSAFHKELELGVVPAVISKAGVHHPISTPWRL
jgi:hypothetical protein